MYKTLDDLLESLGSGAADLVRAGWHPAPVAVVLVGPRKGVMIRSGLFGPRFYEELTVMRTGFLKLVLLVVLAPWLSGSVAAQRDFQPDPAAVERFGPAYRYPQAGWLVLHVEGDPYDRGVQHGRLMAKEIEGHLKSFALMYSPKAPADSWRFLRLLTESLFLRGFEREYLEEMRGIADGARRRARSSTDARWT